MHASIVVTSPYREVTGLIKQIAEELEIDIIVIEEILDNAAKVIKEMLKEQKGIEVIVSRGGTAEAIKEIVDLPVVIIEGTDFDILQALWEAKVSGARRIAFVAYKYHEIDYDFRTIEKILGIEVQQYLYTQRQHIAEQVQEAYHDGVEALVGGGEYGVSLAEAHGMKGGLIRSSRRAVVQALQRAQEILNIVKKERANKEQLQTIINNTYEGIIALDMDNTITVLNSVAERILGMKAADVVGIGANELSQLINAEGLFTEDSHSTNQIRQIGHYQVLINRIPIHSDGEYFGLVYTFQDVTKIQNIEQHIRQAIYRKGLVAKFSIHDIVAQSQVMQELLKRTRKFGATDATVLISGESGTGKELFAQSLHTFSSRRNGPFVAVNCAALPENLLESELFGYEEGAFTGAKKGGKLGLFELAHGGTIFLDEIGTITLNLQARLLRVLQEKEVRRVGGDRIVPVDVRIIAATNVNLKQMVEQMKFRQDLYFRLNVLNIKIPPLRERKEDIPHLVNHFLRIYNNKLNKEIKEFAPELWQWFLQYEWPGNVRELENIVERCVIITEGQIVDAAYLDSISEEAADCLPATKGIQRDLKLKTARLADMEHEIIQQLQDVVKNKSELAKILGISRTTLWKKTKED
ncbi:MAG: sigma 54-interacting transcriptional regulator [Desulfitobacteriaceae bacterium]|nr:sigma 54-interacting transcriptional regulator [Desulfitobacteriaceae bacterium]MDI6880470.1 sigma 54-interacting transcriptional regulator [Desulfitobacteriaceae bacterium]MDI6915235.1 sigma 54-interacting transcriptional regulator [Desulfitobacteriaceae bacterium]